MVSKLKPLKHSSQQTKSVEEAASTVKAFNSIEPAGTTSKNLLHSKLTSGFGDSAEIIINSSVVESGVSGISTKVAIVNCYVATHLTQVFT